MVEIVRVVEAIWLVPIVVPGFLGLVPGSLSLVAESLGLVPACLSLESRFGPWVPGSGS